MSAEQEVAALRLMLREVATLDATGIDYALRCQRERDAAQREAEEAARAYNDVAADLRKTTAKLAATKRELHRLIHGTAIEGDGLCPEGIRAEGHRAWARLWHREARRLWRRVENRQADERIASDWRAYVAQWEANKITQARAAALREAADIAREHGGISAYYAIRELAAEAEP